MGTVTQDKRASIVEAERIRDVNETLALDTEAFLVAWLAFQNTPVDLLDDTDDGTCRCVGNAIRAYLAIVSALQRTAWQPIETAPKDGSEILILTNIGVTQARFAPGEWHDYQEGREYEGPVWVCCDDQWEIEIEDAGAHGMRHGIATHWMPLPAAPVVAEKRSAKS